MHFEILVEGQTELSTLSVLLPKIVGDYHDPHTWKIHKHRGIGKLPDNLADRPNPKDPSLLHNLPAKLRAYGRSLQVGEVVVVLVDLDDRESCTSFKQELIELLRYCEKPPRALFYIAIEELEAWFLGDRMALQAAYPTANVEVLNSYQQDSQCGTWEVLADAVYPGGISALHSKHGARSVRILEHKRLWAKKIAPLMNVDANLSPSFSSFRDGIREILSND